MRTIQIQLLSLLALLGCLLLPGRGLVAVAAGLGESSLPPGFQLLQQAPGVRLYRKDYPNGNPDFVQVIDLQRGAAVRLLAGQITEPRKGKGVYGGDDPRFTQLSLEQFWRLASSQSPQAFCVFNGQFFYMPENPTRLAFPLKVDGTVLSDGWGLRTFPGQKLMLELYADHAQISELSGEALYASDAPNILGGLTENANKSARKAVGRTFIGVEDADGDGASETLLAVSTLSATQEQAADVLRAFGAQRVMMLDGGGSTQLICQGKKLVDSDRPIPQALAVIAAPPRPWAGLIAQAPHWLVVVEGEPSAFRVAIQNDGTQTWSPGEMSVTLEPGEHNPAESYPIEQVVLPGDTVVLTWTLSAFTVNGVAPLRVDWAVSADAQSFQAPPLRARIVVIPAGLSGEKAALEQEIRTWQTSQPQEVETRVREWLAQRNIEAALAKAQPYLANPSGWLWVLMVMLPVSVGILALVLRIQRSGEDHAADQGNGEQEE